ncbi:ATP-dependent zinc protease [Teredinibacter sp. KSP-S5-2]|uniref:ATP-dependent zinc protease family protein n=1 Tax=Teredinibacter sp. KSP-S5-2 TaxID=3034506 RepID=UPI002934C5F0|nr:ATP-dependent zinc protease [Teredinibacter sp. KSP-S5-2]WNO09498.1 ATP-dependent zinc protease [Teredinibacter sp. KSP-S5-2]
MYETRVQSYKNRYSLRFNFGVLKLVGLWSCLSFVLSGCGAGWGTKSVVDDEAFIDVITQQTRAIEEGHEQLVILSEMHRQLSEELAETKKQVDLLYKKLAAAKSIELASKKQNVVVKESPPTKKQTKEPLDGKLVLGRIEWVWLDLMGQTLKAKVDTGAKSSSLSAENIQEFERDGQRWVRFNMPEDPDKKVYEAPLIKYQNVRQASVEEMDQRPKVMLVVRIGDLSEETEFTLADRSNMNYPVLLGRRFLRDIAVVDVARKFVQDKFETQNQKAVDKLTSRSDSP